MKPIITASDIQDMVRHHLGTPPNGYLGSDYGADIKTMLQKSEGTGVADSFLSKMRKDVPVLAAMPGGSVNLFAQDVGNGVRNIIVDVAGQEVTIG